MTKQKFKATLIKDAEIGGWTKFDIPFNVEKTFGEKGYVKVKGKIDNYSFSNIKLMPVGDGTHCMAIKEEIRKAIGKGNGDLVTVEMELDKDELSIPADFTAALNKNKKAKEFFNSLTESGKNYFIDWIVKAKQQETRAKRIVVSVEKLEAGKKYPTP